MKNVIKVLFLSLFIIATGSNGELSASAASAAAVAAASKTKKIVQCGACKKSLSANMLLRHVLIEHQKANKDDFTYGAVYYAQVHGLDLRAYGLEKYSLPDGATNAQEGKQQAESAKEPVSKKRAVRSCTLKQKKERSESESESDGDDSSDSEESSDFDGDSIADESDDVRQPKRKRLKNTPGNFTCDQCQTVFTDRGNMRRHIKTIHEGLKLNANKPVKCNLCNKMQSNSANLIRHQFGVHKVKPYKCYVSGCKEAFKTYREAEQHIKTTHKVIPIRAKLELDHKRMFEMQNDAQTKKKNQKDTNGAAQKKSVKKEATAAAKKRSNKDAAESQPQSDPVTLKAKAKPKTRAKNGIASAAAAEGASQVDEPNLTTLAVAVQSATTQVQLESAAQDKPLDSAAEIALNEKIKTELSQTHGTISDEASAGAHGAALVDNAMIARIAAALNSPMLLAHLHNQALKDLTAFSLDQHGVQLSEYQDPAVLPEPVDVDKESSFSSIGALPPLVYEAADDDNILAD